MTSGSCRLNILSDLGSRCRGCRPDCGGIKGMERLSPLLSSDSLFRPQLGHRWWAGGWLPGEQVLLVLAQGAFGQPGAELRWRGPSCGACSPHGEACTSMWVVGAGAMSASWGQHQSLLWISGTPLVDDGSPTSGFFLCSLLNCLYSWEREHIAAISVNGFISLFPERAGFDRPRERREEEGSGCH